MLTVKNAVSKKILNRGGKAELDLKEVNIDDQIEIWFLEISNKLYLPLKGSGVCRNRNDTEKE